MLPTNLLTSLLQLRGFLGFIVTLAKVCATCFQGDNKLFLAHRCLIVEFTEDGAQLIRSQNKTNAHIQGRGPINLLQTSLFEVKRITDHSHNIRAPSSANSSMAKGHWPVWHPWHLLLPWRARHKLSQGLHCHWLWKFSSLVLESTLYIRDLNQQPCDFHQFVLEKLTDMNILVDHRFVMLCMWV
jgi:hypothetical protein